MKNQIHILLVAYVTLTLLQASCTAKRSLTGERIPHSAMEWVHFLFDTSAVHSGLFVVEARSENTNVEPVIDFNSRSLFTPASNTKLLTLYASLKFLPERLTGLKYLTSDSMTYVKGTGDPGFLDPRFKFYDVLEFLNDQEDLIFVSDWDSDRRWGPGWSWDDYPYYYSGQLSPLPIYGNMVYAWCQNGEWQLFPGLFIHNTISNRDYFRVKREEDMNIFQLNTARCADDTLRIPFVWNQEVLTTLLEDTLQQNVDWVPALPADVEEHWHQVPGTLRDTLLRAMMYESDNMIAEQMLMNISSTLWDTLNTSMVIDSLLDTDFVSWQDNIRWVDGSGLSIYNKFSPRFLVELLQRLYRSRPFDQLSRYFPAGGVRGTISSWYGNDDEPPYVYAKTGTLSGVHCLSGYLLADSGKTYVFSFMHNNYLGSSNKYKEKMETLLQFLKLNL